MRTPSNIYDKSILDDEPLSDLFPLRRSQGPSRRQEAAITANFAREVLKAEGGVSVCFQNVVYKLTDCAESRCKCMARHGILCEREGTPAPAKTNVRSR
jgi:hypothetical protein